MWLPRSRVALALSVVAVIVLAFAVTTSVGLLTGDGIHLGSVKNLGPPPRVIPQIVRFDGPSVVRCPKAGGARSLAQDPTQEVFLRVVRVSTSTQHSMRPLSRVASTASSAEFIM